MRQVRPGPAWRELLLAPEAADWLLGLLPALRGAAATQPLARAARQLLARWPRHCMGSFRTVWACMLRMRGQQQRQQCVSVRADGRPAQDDRQHPISSTYDQCGTGCLGVAVLCSEDPCRQHHAGNAETWQGHFCAEVSLCLLGGNRLRLRAAAHIWCAMRTPSPD